MPREGDRINNYLLDRRVGVGSFGEVWRARHHIFDEVVAIKIPTDPQYVRNLRQEGVVIHGLRHPNIVRALDLDPFGDPPYLIMEYIDGPSLREAIDSWRERFPVPSAVTILRGVLGALSASHAAGMIHRDIKPANILLNCSLSDIESITEPAVRVTDFGLGLTAGATNRSIMQSGSHHAAEGRKIAGTIVYMSPEQEEGHALDARSDLYACGIVLFEMLTGQRPQGHDLPSALRSDVPRYLDEVFRRSYARLEKRYASAKDMLSALTTSGPPPVPSRAKRGISDTCPACGQNVDRHDHFCIHCGHQLVASVPRCPNPTCQAYVHGRDRFCIYCGTSLQVLT